MMKYKLTNMDAATRLHKLFSSYLGSLEFDVSCGSRAVDGFSIIGLSLMVGKEVVITAIGSDREKIKEFYIKLEECLYD